ncbi:hypothetical protein BH18ACI2_BH18ACI2_16100 [soil metagenome]
MTQVLRLPFLVLTLLCLSAGASLQAQTATPSPTPDPFIIQITSTPPMPLPSPATGSFLANSFVRDISGNGRFVVIESDGNIATENPDNADGNREVFLFDYAQRRIFQITRTKSALANAMNSPLLISNIAVEVSNTRPMLSRDGKWIVFSSNAPTPGNFDGDAEANETALRADGNQEIFLYRIPDVPDADLTSGAEVPLVNLSGGDFRRITDTPASRLPTPGSNTQSPFVADDNREASINDRGTRIAFISTRNLAPSGARNNEDANPEIFVWDAANNGTISQLTVTSGLFTFSSNPSISGGTTDDTSSESPNSVIAFVSNATGLTSNNADGNAEVFYATFNGVVDMSSVTQVTRTRSTTPGFIVNTFSPGRRISRDGNLIAFESIAADPGANADTASGQDTVFVYNIAAQGAIAAQSFTQIGPRPDDAGGEVDVPLRFPTFSTDSTGATRVIFISTLNIRASDGTRLPLNDATGSNPNRRVQIFSAPVGQPSATSQIVVLTNTPVSNSLATPQPVVSNTVERLAFSFANIEFGTGNSDGNSEAYYQVLPPTQGTNVPPDASLLQYFTGASERPIVTPSPSPSPSPSPTPTPVTGLAPGMLAIVRTTPDTGVTFASSAVSVCPDTIRECSSALVVNRSPSLPVELNGVSVSINNAAAGLYFVGPEQITFVVPSGLAATTGTNTLPVVIRVREAVGVRTIRSQIQIVPAQPDIFADNNRAVVFNVTGMMMMPEPPEGFPVMTGDMPTTLALMLTGVRNVTASQVTVTIGDRTFTGNQITFVGPTPTPGIDQINFMLRADVAGIGDQPIIVSVTIGQQTFTSRPADTAPRIRIR